MTSPNIDALWINPRLLRKLSMDHAEAAKDIAAITPLATGTAAAILKTHGVVCRSTSAAAEKAAAARENACIAIQSMSEAHAHNLDSAASKYTVADEGGRDRISREMPRR
ncbi:MULTISPECIES: type VII secretion target [unclassified Mycolicibacterium]|uniref:type VII secretion target n=1 Tax=unclassified Mycolicibacterium TaxID=2636767 RepID=UPI0012DCE991|nr:ESX-1 secretion-associated protein [Mycolicibacterium sp. CBMA 329]MUL89180.1 ESX-1 secretion-associated protein [Mycolicibacterium sp. CBMA 331]MUL97747.1 ESX-1 secretion-associated protein [Mycolicibacterium sp. CBMA 334]MUM25140.1 ESX-1 secretion-associated protein [Mycolicibacterium sp. CBMA 295]MUM38696.1 ESX-1 secretion-associated protein [Mycolicibacterium sp. CBMA 247]MUM45244.1 ESX-1 secretion-associated protein [Mycolicibacterium sp. CBMA 294]